MMAIDGNTPTNVLMEQLALRLGWLRQSGGELGIETAELALQIFERLARDAALSLRRAILLQRPVAPGGG